jgi:hypothetical protein
MIRSILLKSRGWRGGWKEGMEGLMCVLSWSGRGMEVKEKSLSVLDNVLLAFLIVDSKAIRIFQELLDSRLKVCV